MWGYGLSFTFFSTGSFCHLSSNPSFAPWTWMSYLSYVLLNFMLFPQWFFKNSKTLFSLFFLCLNIIHLCILLECACLQVTMLTLSGLRNKEDLLSHMKRGLELGWLQGWPLQTISAQTKGSGLFHLSSWLSTGRSLSSPHSFRMAVAVPTAIPRRTAAQGRRGYSFLCFLFIGGENFPRSWPWLSVFV